MQRRPQPRTNHSFTKAAIMLVALILIVVVTSRLNNQGLPRSLGDLFSTDDLGGHHPFGPFTEEQKKVYLDKVVGFWSGARDDGGEWMGGHDAVELKDNGIVWRVIERWAVTPAGDTVRERRTYDAYLRPFGRSTEREGVVACDVRILRQHRVTAHDTCFGPENVDVVWLLESRGDSVVFNGVRLGAYSGELSSFFPEGALDGLEDAYMARNAAKKAPAYELGQGNVVLEKPLDDTATVLSLELPKCAPRRCFATVVRDTVAGTLAAMSPAAVRDSAATMNLIDTLYRVLLVDDLREKPGIYQSLAGTRVGVEVLIDARGEVIAATVADPTPDQTALREKLLAHAHAWRFPPVTAADTLSLIWTGTL